MYGKYNTLFTIQNDRGEILNIYLKDVDFHLVYTVDPLDNYKTEWPLALTGYSYRYATDWWIIVQTRRKRQERKAFNYRVLGSISRLMGLMDRLFSRRCLRVHLQLLCWCGGGGGYDIKEEAPVLDRGYERLRTRFSFIPDWTSGSDISLVDWLLRSVTAI